MRKGELVIVRVVIELKLEVEGARELGVVTNIN